MLFALVFLTNICTSIGKKENTANFIWILQWIRWMAWIRFERDKTYNQKIHISDCKDLTFTSFATWDAKLMALAMFVRPRTCKCSMVCIAFNFCWSHTFNIGTSTLASSEKEIRQNRSLWSECEWTHKKHKRHEMTVSTMPSLDTRRYRSTTKRTQLS